MARTERSIRRDRARPNATRSETLHRCGGGRTQRIGKSAILGDGTIERIGRCGMTEGEEGVKADEGKPNWALLPVGPLRELVEVIDVGAKKYAPRDWEKGMPFSRMYSAMQRHAWAWWDGEVFDREDGRSHLIKVAFCAFAMREWERRGVGTDDRPRDANTPYEIVRK